MYCFVFLVLVFLVLLLILYGLVDFVSAGNKAPLTITLCARLC